ncbi:MAG: alpha/beta hydrolase [Peptostreptococcaceae bacterium]|nr:alpha/beta hydrolase [Peptostreptococcaceae bacterium]
MTIHEFGKENEKLVLLIHPSVVMWDFFEYVIPLMEKYHLVIPALPGYDPDREDDFSSIERIASELEDWLLENNLNKVDCIYGCSMGGGIALRMLVNNRIRIQSAIIDGGITPYSFPWIITRFIAVKDFLLIYMGKLGGIKLLQKAFSTDEYSNEDLQYIEKVLKRMSVKTIWRTFDSCNNYSMPQPMNTECERIEYWFADAEEKSRKRDIAYIQKNFPSAKLRRIENIGHGGLAILKPEKLVDGIEKLCAGEK